MESFISSAARIAANLANSGKSTGPKTTEGKEKSSQNARKHGLSGARFFCPEHLRPLLNDIEEQYRTSIRPQGFLEEDAFLQLRNSRFNMERAQILMDELGRTAEARGVDPIADPETRKDYLLYQRYFNQANSNFQRYYRLIEKLQSERTLREQSMRDPGQFPGLAAVKPVIRATQEHYRHRALQQKLAQEQATQQLLSFINSPMPGEYESKPGQPQAA